MYLGKADVNTYQKGSSREFLTSNGWGGFGFSTVIGANTRREHGLLVVKKSGEEVYPDVLISKVDETVVSRGKKYHLSTNRYTDVIYPDGFRYLQEYQAEPLPGMLFVIHSVFLRKTVFMPRNMQATIIKYELLSAPESIQIEIRPLAAHRGMMEVCPDKSGSDFESFFSKNSVTINGRGLQSHISFHKGEWSQKPLWFENLMYESDECERPGIDTLWSPGILSLDMSEGESVYIMLSSKSGSIDQSQGAALETATSQWILGSITDTPLMKKTPLARDLIQSASHCVSETDGKKPIIFSGYPSVRETARETFISIPGLLLVTGKTDTAKKLLQVWLDRAVMNGHVMPSDVDPHGGSISTEAADSGLWFFYALNKYCDQSGSTEFAEENWKDLVAMLRKFREGIKEIGLEIDQNGLLSLRSDNLQSNWMARGSNGSSIIQRRGNLVEFNSLWYNALRTMEQYAGLLGDENEKKEFGELATLCWDSFPKIFWNEKGYLNDWVDGEDKDESIRCNQILAVSLPVSVMDPERGRSIVETCWNELYTTFGLRTLDPHHDKYKGSCEGRLDQREKARFMGMAWPWLLGQFITAYLRYNPDRKDIAWCFLRPFISHLRKGCLGGVAQIFDGSMPYRSHGDALYAPSVAELLRVIGEDM
ncbi:MAG: amylo-alpha-1,6-glucosidase [Thermovirgaceae bacterium]|nr:amylo-alpha-1,6-glucosidase [Thermovirgaceae bacterium]